MRTAFMLSAFALIASSASAQTYSHEPNTYRFGGTYSITGSGSADSCAASCSRDSNCITWSFQRATTTYGPAKCELKQTTGRAEANPLMISGINPRLAREGQTRVQRAPSGLLGGPSRPAAVNVIRNGTVSSRPAPARLATPAGTRITSTPVITSSPGATPVPVRTIPPPPAGITVPPVVTPLPPTPAANISAPTPPAVPAPVVPAPTVNVPAAVVPPAPVIAPTPSGPATSAIPAAPEVPQGAIVRDAPPPQISFEPLSDTPPPPPAIPSQPASATEDVTATYPRRTRSERTPPRPIETVPAGTVPTATPTPSRPYDGLGSRSYPKYSVARDSARTPEELAAEQAALEASGQTIENLDLGDIDLADDIGEPIDQAPLRQRARRTPDSTS